MPHTVQSTGQAGEGWAPSWLKAVAQTGAPQPRPVSTDAPCLAGLVKFSRWQAMTGPGVETCRPAQADLGSPAATPGVSQGWVFYFPAWKTAVNRRAAQRSDGGKGEGCWRGRTICSGGDLLLPPAFAGRYSVYAEEDVETGSIDNEVILTNPFHLGYPQGGRYPALTQNG